MREFTLEDLKGRSVIDTTGTTLGKVSDVLVDPSTWEVRSLLVTLTKDAADDLRIEKPVFRDAHLAISRERVAAVGESVLLNVGRDDIAARLREDAMSGTPGGVP